MTVSKNVKFTLQRSSNSLAQSGAVFFSRNYEKKYTVKRLTNLSGGGYNRKGYANRLL